MTPNELRIGNWAIQPQLPHIAKITAIDYRGDDYYCKFEGIHAGCWCSEIESIPLTEELLLKCGFSQTYSSDPQQPDVVKKYSENVFELFSFEKTNDILFFAGSKEIAIVFLHQLQNLYFALTGKELEVQL